MHEKTHAQMSKSLEGILCLAVYIGGIHSMPHFDCFDMYTYFIYFLVFILLLLF